jgi:hypothetical protein
MPWVTLHSIPPHPIPMHPIQSRFQPLVMPYCRHHTYSFSYTHCPLPCSCCAWRQPRRVRHGACWASWMCPSTCPVQPCWPTWCSGGCLSAAAAPCSCAPQTSGVFYSVSLNSVHCICVVRCMLCMQRRAVELLQVLKCTSWWQVVAHVMCTTNSAAVLQDVRVVPRHRIMAWNGNIANCHDGVEPHRS